MNDNLIGISNMLRAALPEMLWAPMKVDETESDFALIGPASAFMLLILVVFLGQNFVKPPSTGYPSR